jgi:hypothetical protein
MKWNSARRGRGAGKQRSDGSDGIDAEFGLSRINKGSELKGREGAEPQAVRMENRGRRAEMLRHAGMTLCKQRRFCAGLSLWFGVIGGKAGNTPVYH